MNFTGYYATKTMLIHTQNLDQWEKYNDFYRSHSANTEKTPYEKLRQSMGGYMSVKLSRVKDIVKVSK
jgi:hypothetical protein